jgi:uncharacterized membrane protein
MYSERVNHIPEHIRKHINTIAEQEKEFRLRQSAVERAGHAIGAFVGSFPFILLHVVWFGIWLLINTNSNSWLPRFDPFPFSLLATLIEIEGIFLASFILMRQNRISRRSDEREHLILQVLLLAEQEITTLIDIERRKSAHHGLMDIAHDPDVKTLSQPTSVDDLTRGLMEELPLE